MGHTHGSGDQEAARQLAAEIKAKWPTASILDWSNGEAEDTTTFWGSIDGPCIGQLLDAEGEHLAEPEGKQALQAIAMKYAKDLGWHEAELDMQHFFSIKEARDVSDGENGYLEPGFKHTGWEFLEQ